MNELEMPIEAKSLVLDDVLMEGKYTSKKGIFLGKQMLVEYGFNYNNTKGNPNQYCINSPLINIKEERKQYPTEEEARNNAIHIAKYIIQNFFKIK